VRTAVGQVVHKFGGELLLQPLQLANFGFGLDYLLVMVWDSLISSCYSFLVRYPWRKVCHLCLAIQSRVFFRNDSLSRLRCSRVALAYGWVTIVILSMVKRAHPLYSKRLWAHTIFRRSNQKIDWEDLLSCSYSCSQSLLQQRNPNPLFEAP
jgi:hypothetical protein